ncbi:hypothetical protein H320_21060 [Vibrio parahaemolyticus 49]|nr:hypothetical protein [Vibrio parahaemolyticus]EMR38911.1 hypothetical protein MUQ_00750 [Vibrio harveyi CAIM 1792]KIT40302.1 hypothetical protein H320_21060 [Vibrio parahaemolyticus 49]EGQ8886753.1 hypothetical protein [Vibrio parahaemolyticus]EGQ8913310.1 hypothetical protein [Vibrio parahaemolyticus]
MSKNLVNISLEEQQAQLESRKHYTFFKDGYIDGYSFAFGLFESLWLDGFDVKNPTDLLNALCLLIENEHVEQEKVFETHINDMTPEAYAMYPEGKTILFHCTFFLHNIHNYISHIGERVIQIPRTEKDMLYSWWLKRENVYTYTYLDTFMKQFTEILDSMPSFRPMVMNLHISRHIPDEEFSAYSTIIKKEERSKHIVERIDEAINQEFYLEAIALEESCISDRLSLVLYLKGQKAGTKSFAKLTELCDEFLPKNLKRDVDSWRKERNRSIHNLVRSSPLEEMIDLEELDLLSVYTAKKGLKLLDDVNIWFEEFILSEMNPFCLRLQEEVTLN